MRLGSAVVLGTLCAAQQRAVAAVDVMRQLQAAAAQCTTADAAGRIAKVQSACCPTARQVDTFVERDQPADGTRAGEQLASKTRGLRGLAARVPQSVRKQQQQSGSDCPSPMREKESHWAR
eukprot:COSAG02_NODE_17997_length_966_cov_4.412918_2_plen_120_part_01